MPSSCVCPSFTFWYCIKTAKRRITQIMPHDRFFKFCNCRISTDKCLAVAELLVNVGGLIHISGMVEAKVVKFCSQGDYIKSCQGMICHCVKEHGCGHVTLLNS